MKKKKLNDPYVLQIVIEGKICVGSFFFSILIKKNVSKTFCRHFFVLFCGQTAANTYNNNNNNKTAQKAFHRKITNACSVNIRFFLFYQRFSQLILFKNCYKAVLKHIRRKWRWIEHFLSWKCSTSILLWLHRVCYIPYNFFSSFLCCCWFGWLYV